MATMPAKKMAKTKTDRLSFISYRLDAGRRRAVKLRRFYSLRHGSATLYSPVSNWPHEMHREFAYRRVLREQVGEPARICPRYAAEFLIVFAVEMDTHAAVAFNAGDEL